MYTAAVVRIRTAALTGVLTIAMATDSDCVEFGCLTPGLRNPKRCRL
jgi:hypothetical protein